MTTCPRCKHQTLMTIVQVVLLTLLVTAAYVQFVMNFYPIEPNDRIPVPMRPEIAVEPEDIEL